MGVAHLTLDLGSRHEGRDRVDDDEIDGTGPHEHVGDLQRLLTGVRLRHQQGIDVDAQLRGVVGVERVLRVDERRDTTRALRIGDGVQGECGLTRGLRAVDLHDAATRQASDPEGDVEGDGAGGDDCHGGALIAAQPHDRALPN